MRDYLNQPFLKLKQTLLLFSAIFYLNACEFNKQEKEAIILQNAVDTSRVVEGTSFALEKTTRLGVSDLHLKYDDALVFTVPESFHLKGGIIWHKNEVKNQFRPQNDFRIHSDKHQCGFILMPNLEFADIKGKNKDDEQNLAGANNPFRMVQPAEDAMRSHIFEMLQQRLGKVKVSKVHPAAIQEIKSENIRFTDNKTMEMDFEFESADEVYDAFIKANYYIEKIEETKTEFADEMMLNWGYKDLVCYYFQKGKRQRIEKEIISFYATKSISASYQNQVNAFINQPLPDKVQKMQQTQNKRLLMLKSNADNRQRAFSDKQAPFHADGNDWWDKQMRLID